MKKNLILFAAAIVAMVSCSKNEPVDTASNPDAINFSTFVGNQTSKAVEITPGSFKNFHIDAYYTAQTSFAEGTRVSFMHDETATKAEEGGAWSYSPIKYWPNNDDDKISFFVYSTNTGVISAPIVEMADLASASTTSTTPATLVFTCPKTAVTQVDLLADAVYDKTKADGNVKFEFEHTLSQVKFNVKAAVEYNNQTTITIKSARVDYSSDASDGSGTSGFAGKGTYSFATSGTPETLSKWTEISGSPMTIDYLIGSSALNDGKQVVVHSKKDPIGVPLMLIPQPAVDGDITFTIIYDVKTADAAVGEDGVVITNTASFKVTPNNVLVKGKKYIYNLVIGLTEIKVAGSVGDWATDTAGENFTVAVEQSEVIPEG